MTLVRAAELGVDRLANDRGKANWPLASAEARETIIGAVHRHVLAQQHLMRRAPHNREEMLHHFTTLEQQGEAAEIDSSIDCPEDLGRFGPGRGL